MNNNNQNFSVSFSFDDNYIYNDFSVSFNDKKIQDKGFLTTIRDIDKYFRPNEIENNNKNRDTRICIDNSNHKKETLCYAEIFMNLTKKESKQIKNKIFIKRNLPDFYEEEKIEINNYDDYLSRKDLLRYIIEPKQTIENEIFSDKVEEYYINKKFLENHENIFKAIKFSIFKNLSYRQIEKELDINESNNNGYYSLALFKSIGFKTSRDKKISNYYTVNYICNVINQNKIWLSNNLKKHNIDFGELIDYLSIEKTKDFYNNKSIEEQNLEYEDQFYEGELIKQHILRYERNNEARNKAIKIHGLNCYVCGYNFKNHFSDLGDDFIEVHHIKPISLSKHEHKINPKNDLVCLCANCHRMVHRYIKKHNDFNIENFKKIYK